jgi:colicin import membrane protein
MRWSWWSPRMVISWLDRNPWAAVAFAVLLLAALAAHPFLFVLVPLLMLGVVALGVTDFGEKSVMDFYRGQKRVVEQQAQVGAGPQRRNRQSRADDARAQAERMLSQSELEGDARARAQVAEAEALAAEARARAQVAEAEALAAEARARAIRLRV